MIDYMLRTDTEAQMDDALIAAGVAIEIDGAVIAAEGVTIDRIGPIPPSYGPDGKVTSQGDTRFHANIRCMVELTEEQEAELPTFAPEPSVPYRVFL